MGTTFDSMFSARKVKEMVQTKYSGTGWWNRPFVLGVLEMRSSVSRVFRLREGNLVRRVYFSPWSERERERPLVQGGGRKRDPGNEVA